MLTRDDNELLCRVGPGTPMGNLMRQYWLPAGLSSELPEADGAPKDFSLDDPMDLPSGQPYTRAAQGKRVPEGPLLSWLWQEALKEWP